jgi:hypothetical protein
VSSAVRIDRQEVAAAPALVLLVLLKQVWMSKPALATSVSLAVVLLLLHVDNGNEPRTLGFIGGCTLLMRPMRKTTVQGIGKASNSGFRH